MKKKKFDSFICCIPIITQKSDSLTFFMLSIVNNLLVLFAIQKLSDKCSFYQQFIAENQDNIGYGHN